RIATIALSHVGESFIVAGGGVMLALFSQTSLRSFFRRRGQKEFYVGIGKDNRADISAVHHCPAPAQLALPAYHRPPHCRDRGNHRGDARNVFVTAELSSVRTTGSADA